MDAFNVNSVRWILGSLAALSLVACGGGDDKSTDVSTSAATEEDYDDVSQSLGVAVASSNNGGEVGSFSDAVAIAVGLPPLDLQVKASGEFAGSRAGLSYDYSGACRDAQEQSLDACGVATDDASVRVSWSGDLALPNFSARVQRNGQWQLANLKSGTAEFNGTSDFAFDAQFQSSFRNVARHWNLDYRADYAAVRVQILPRQIVGGSIRYALTADRQASSDGGQSAARFAMTADISFAAGGATLVLDGSHAYAVDLTTGAVRRQAQ